MSMSNKIFPASSRVKVGEAAKRSLSYSKLLALLSLSKSSTMRSGSSESEKSKSQSGKSSSDEEISIAIADDVIGGKGDAGMGTERIEIGASPRRSRRRTKCTLKLVSGLVDVPCESAARPTVMIAGAGDSLISKTLPGTILYT